MAAPSSVPVFPIAPEAPGTTAFNPYVDGAPQQPPAQAPLPHQLCECPQGGWRENAARSAPGWYALLTPFEIQRIDALPTDGTQQAVVAGLMRQQVPPSSFISVVRSGNQWLSLQEGAARLRLALGLTADQSASAYLTLFLISPPAPQAAVATGAPAVPPPPYFSTAAPGKTSDVWSVLFPDPMRPQKGSIQAESETTPLVGGVVPAPTYPSASDELAMNLFAARIAAAITVLLSFAAFITNIVLMVLFVGALSSDDPERVTALSGITWGNFGVTIAQTISLLATAYFSHTITGRTAAIQALQVCFAAAIIVILMILYFAFWNIIVNVLLVIIIFMAGITCIPTWVIVGQVMNAAVTSGSTTSSLNPGV